MAADSLAQLIIAGLGHVYHAPVDTEPFDLKTYEFDGDSSASGILPYKDTKWTWLGDHSAESMPEFSSDGGEPTIKRTWDRHSVKTTYSPETVTGTLHMVGLTMGMFRTAFGNIDDSAGNRWKVSSASKAKSVALFIVVEDGTHVAGLYLPNVSLKGGFPNFSTEEFTEIPINLAINGSLKSTTDGAPTLWEWMPARERKSASSTGQ